MRIVDVRQDHEQEDIFEGRKVIDIEIGHPSMSVMIIHGNTAAVSKFANLASARCDPFPWRSGVWVRDDRIFTAENKKEWFEGHDTACAVILDLNDRPAERLLEDATLFDIEQAWLSAEGR
jgi:hypothetical protein